MTSLAQALLAFGAVVALAGLAPVVAVIFGGAGLAWEVYATNATR